jgi:16S rRNA (adenine1518-N6/adenine1519-N6)-dimethyltransferase
MSLAPLNVSQLLTRFKIKPDKRLGQNFLVEQAVLEQVVAVAEIKKDDHILEIGPGLGSLTRLLAERGKRVVAVELDTMLFPVLEFTLAAYQNVKLVQGDILAFDPARLMENTGYVVVANIPYYITSALIRHLLEASLKPKLLVLTIQQEVAERICAKPGDLSLLALSVQVYGKPRITLQIPAAAFYPQPKVDSAVVSVDLYEQPVIPDQLIDLFFRMAKAGFSQKRKNLRNSLSAGMQWSTGQAESVLREAGIAADRRAQTLNLAEWQQLTEVTSSLT